MGRSPYTPERKAMVSQEYLDGKAPLSDIAKRYGVHKETILCWAQGYQEQGMSAFERGSGYTTYATEFKMKNDGFGEKKHSDEAHTPVPCAHGAFLASP